MSTQGDGGPAIATNPGVAGLAQLGRNAIERVAALERELDAQVEVSKLIAVECVMQRRRAERAEARLAEYENAPVVALVDDTPRGSVIRFSSQWKPVVGTQLIVRPAKEGM